MSVADVPAGVPGGAVPASRAGEPDPRRWFILAVVGLAQLMIVLDITVMNIALPSAQRALHFSNVDRQWVITAYALAFGSLLLFGGRLGDLFGRKVTFLTGLAGFAIASAVGGASVNFTMLITARACQGAFGALLAPAALSVLTTTFSDPKERGKAFGVYGAIAGGGGLVGLLLGGVLTEYLNWRWCLYVNLIFAVAAAAGAVVFLSSQRSAAAGARLDWLGTLLVSGSMFCLVFGFSNAATHSWHAKSTWGFLAAGVVLLAGFVAWQFRAAHPLLPPRVVLDRNRGGAYLAILIVGASMFGLFLFLTYYLQTILGYSPVITGVAFLPAIVMVMIFAQISNIVLMPRVGPKPLVGFGMLIAAVGMAWLTRIGVHSSYASARARAADGGRCRHRPFDASVDEHRDLRRGAQRRRRRVRHAQRRPAARRLHRHRAAQHDRHQRGRGVRGQPSHQGDRDLAAAAQGARSGGRRARIHDRVLVDGRLLRRRSHRVRGLVPPRATRPAGAEPAAGSQQPQPAPGQAPGQSVRT